MSVRSIPLPFAMIASDSTSATFSPVTGWMSAAQISQLRAIWELVSLTSDIEVAPAYQVANVEDSPGTSAIITGSYGTTTGMKYPSTWKDVSSALDSQQLIRLGWLHKLGSAGSLAVAWVGGKVEMYQE